MIHLAVAVEAAVRFVFITKTTLTTLYSGANTLMSPHAGVRYTKHAQTAVESIQK